MTINPDVINAKKVQDAYHREQWRRRGESGKDTLSRVINVALGIIAKDGRCSPQSTRKPTERDSRTGE